MRWRVWPVVGFALAMYAYLDLKSAIGDMASPNDGWRGKTTEDILEIRADVQNVRLMVEAINERLGRESYGDGR